MLSIIGGIGGSITMLSYNYWMREEDISGADWLGYVRGDVAIAYLFTAIFGMSIMLIANQAFYRRRASPSPTRRRCRRWPKCWARCSDRSASTPIRSGFWAAVFASLLGVWQSVPYLYADFYGVLKKLPVDARREVTKVTSTPYRLALAFITLVPLPFAFTGRPLVDHRHLHHRRQPLHPVPRGHAALSEQSREMDGSGPAQSLDDERRAGRDPGALRDRRRAGGD